MMSPFTPLTLSLSLSTRPATALAKRARPSSLTRSASSRLAASASSSWLSIVGPDIKNECSTGDDASAGVESSACRYARSVRRFFSRVSRAWADEDEEPAPPMVVVALWGVPGEGGGESVLAAERRVEEGLRGQPLDPPVLLLLLGTLTNARSLAGGARTVSSGWAFRSYGGASIVNVRGSGDRRRERRTSSASVRKSPYRRETYTS